MSVSVGIMSMQRIRNYGSSLQAYGLRRMIEGLSDTLDVSFVDFTAGIPLGEEEQQRLSPFGRAVAKVVEYNSIDAGFRDRLQVINHKWRYEKRFFPMMGISQKPVHNLRLDVQVIGSDEVFNCVQSNTNVGYSRDLFGHKSPAKRLITYAASFGNTTLSRIENRGIRGELSDDFARFDAISVRDRNSAHIVENLTGKRPRIHVDPALAYDFMHLEARIPAERQHPGRYIVVYGYSGRLDGAENEALSRYARSIGAAIVCLGGVQQCCDRFINCNPFELLAFFRDAEAVVTDTFHGTIFSIINRKPFGVIIRPSVGARYGNEEKVGFLLESFDLSAQRVTDMTKIKDILGREIDYGSVEEILARERRSAQEYLANTIL